MTKTSYQKTMIKQKEQDRMYLFFPDVNTKELWQRKIHGGFSTVPKTMPLIMALMDSLEKGAPMSMTYFSLWCSTWDSSFLQIKNEKELAVASGFSGERAITTWKKRMQNLAKWGFIEHKEGEHTFSNVLILNPHIVLEKLHNETAFLPEALYNMLIARNCDLNANSFKQMATVVEPTVITHD